MGARRQQGEAEVGLVGSLQQWWKAVGRSATQEHGQGMADGLGGGERGAGRHLWRLAADWQEQVASLRHSVCTA